MNSNDNINNFKNYFSFLNLPDLVFKLTFNFNAFYHLIILLVFFKCIVITNANRDNITHYCPSICASGF